MIISKKKFFEIGRVFYDAINHTIKVDNDINNIDDILEYNEMFLYGDEVLEYCTDNDIDLKTVIELFEGLLIGDDILYHINFEDNYCRQVTELEAEKIVLHRILDYNIEYVNTLKLDEND